MSFRLTLSFWLALGLPVCVALPQSPASVTAKSLQRLLDLKDLIEFAKQLPHAAELTPEQHEYFSGLLAHHTGHFAEAVKPLTAAVNTKDSSLTAN